MFVAILKKTGQQRREQKMCLYIRKTVGMVALSLGMLVASSVHAAILAYHSLADFDAAAAGYHIGDFNFDYPDTPPGTIIYSGTTLFGLNFGYNFGPGVLIRVSNRYTTTSPRNFLGTTDSDIFQAGDNIALSFASLYGIGMYFISADPLIDADIRLSVGAQSVYLDASRFLTLSDGSRAYFLGLTNFVTPFSAVTIFSGDHGQGTFLYNIDDIRTIGMPEPNTRLLLYLGLVALALSKTNKVIPRLFRRRASCDGDHAVS